MSVLLRLLGPAAAGLAPAVVASCESQSSAPPPSSPGATSGAVVQAKPAELQRRLTPLGRTSLLTEIETNRSVPMYLMRVKGRLDREQVVALLNDKMVSADRFRSKIEISPSGEDACFVPVLSSAGDAVVLNQASDLTLNGVAATTIKDQSQLVDMDAPSSSAAVQKSPKQEPSKNGRWSSLPPYDCAPHVKPLYVHLPAVASGDGSAGDLQGASYRGLSNFVAQVANTPVDMPPHLPQWELLMSEPMPARLDSAKKNGAFKKGSADTDLDEMETLLVLRVHHALADGISIAALLTLLTDEGEHLFKELLQGAKGALPASTQTITAVTAPLAPLSNDDGGATLEIPPTSPPPQQSSNRKSQRRGSKKISLLSKLGKMVRFLSKAFSALFMQVAGVPWVLAKYARLIGRSILLANLPFEMIDNGDGTFTGASSFTATLDTVVKEIATRALWPLLYSSDALGLPRLHLRNGAFGMRGRLSTQRQAAWSTTYAKNDNSIRKATTTTSANHNELVDVASLKAGLALMGKKNITVNDAVLAAFASAIGELGSEAEQRDKTNSKLSAAAAGSSTMEEEPASTSPSTHKGPQLVTAIVPVNLRPLLAVLSGRLPDPDAPLSAQVQAMQGNKIGALLFDLPTAVKHPSSSSSSSTCTASSDVASMAPLVSEVSRRVGWCKVTPEALLAYVLAAGSSIFPVRWQRAAQRHTLGQADFAVSNVKGPDNGVHLLGHPVTQIVGFLPPPNGCPLGVAVTSYQGKLQLSINADAGALQRYQRLPQSAEETKEQALTNTSSSLAAGGDNGAQVLLERVESKLHAIAAEGRQTTRK